MCVYHRGFGSTVCIDIVLWGRVGCEYYDVVFVVDGKPEIVIRSTINIEDLSITSWIINKCQTSVSYLINPHNIFNYTLWRRVAAGKGAPP